MTRSMYRSWESNCAMTSRVVTSWMAELGTWVLSSAEEMTLEMATKDSVDSFPPGIM